MSCKWLGKSGFVFLICGVMNSHSLYASFVLPKDEKKQLDNPQYVPWFTGPLLAPTGHVIPKGHCNIEPYIFYTTVTGIYSDHWRPSSNPNFYNANLIIPIQIGIAPAVDIQLNPQTIWNRTQGQNYADIGDFPVAVDFQLLKESPESGAPAIKLTLRSFIPLAKYNHLNPSKLGTDAIGSGSWLPGVTLVFAKLFQFGKGIHFLGSRLVFGYTVGTVAYVKDLNSYGGGEGTRGKVYPGNTFTVDGAIEYNFNQRWSFAMDAVYSHSNKTRFSGKTTAPVTSPSSEQFSLAPALEYSWTENIGVIGGVWFTFAGRNIGRFTSGVIALNVYI